MTDELYEVLYKPKFLDGKIKMLNEEIERLETHLFPSGIRYDKDPVQTSPEDQMSKTLALVADKQIERDRLADEYADAIVAASILISRLPSIDLQRVIHAYYIGCQTWESIAEEMNYSEAWVYKVRRKAMEYLEAIVTSV